MSNISEEKNIEESASGEALKSTSGNDEQQDEVLENVEVEDVSVEEETRDETTRDETTESDAGKVTRESGRGEHRYKSHKGHHEMSFEEKLRAFKKQSEERLLHIKRSREAKIGKKKTR